MVILQGYDIDLYTLYEIVYKTPVISLSRFSLVSSSTGKAAKSSGKSSEQRSEKQVGKLSEYILLTSRMKEGSILISK